MIMGAAQLVAGLVLALAAAGGRRRRRRRGIAAVGGWALTRTVGHLLDRTGSRSEEPQFADTVCAALGAIGLVLGAVVAAGAAGDRRRASASSRPAR